MNLFKRLLSRQPTLDGLAMAQSDQMREYAQIHLLAEFAEPRPLHEPNIQQRWSRALPQPYLDIIQLLVAQGWLASDATGTNTSGATTAGTGADDGVNNAAIYHITPTAVPFVTAYQTRLEEEKAVAMAEVKAAIAARETSEALTLRRRYEERFPLGTADWSGDEPQLSHSALTRRIFFLDHWLLDGLSEETTAWLKQVAAEQHLWGTQWRLLLAEIPDTVQQELATDDLDVVEAIYWRAYQLALLVENQETWQRCKGGDHVRRIEIMGADDEQTCATCREVFGQQFLVSRVPELPHRACTSPYGCRCRYEPVLESYDEIDAA